MLLGASQFFERRGAPTPPLPYDAEVEYLESTGTQWIDTAFRPNPLTTRCEADIVYTSTAALKGLFGVRNINTANSFAVYNWGNRADWVGNTTTVMSISPNVDYHIVCEMNFVRVNDVTYSSGIEKSNVYLEYPFYLFTINDIGVPTSRGGQPQKLRSLRLFDNGILVRDFQPVRFTNELGQSEGAMYDRLGVCGMNPDGSPRTDGLYRNRGTGAFLYGPDKS